jgi:ABC-type proline/glycine betaine transport system permease subunit
MAWPRFHEYWQAKRRESIQWLQHLRDHREHLLQHLPPQILVQQFQMIAWLIKKKFKGAAITYKAGIAVLLLHPDPCNR